MTPPRAIALALLAGAAFWACVGAALVTWGPGLCAAVCP